MLQEEQGYTLIELVVTLLVTLVLGGVVFALYEVTIRQVEPWRREVSLEDDVHLLTARLAADLAYADQLLDHGGGTWTLAYASGRVVRYTYRDGVLARNGRRMHDAALEVAGLRLAPSRAETSHALRRRDTLTEDEHSLVQVEVRLALRSRERTLAVVTTVALRQHRPWYPLP